MTDDDKGDKLYRIETVPPPAGESDAYNAPTKVRPMAAAVVAEMMKAADLGDANARSAEQKLSSAKRGVAADNAPPSQKPKSGESHLKVREERAPRSGRVDARAEDEAGGAAPVVDSASHVRRSRLA